MIDVDAVSRRSGRIQPRLEDAAVRSRAGSQHTVGAVGQHGRRPFLAARRIRERIVAADPERRRDLDVRIDLLGARDEAIREAMQERNVERADGADLAGLGGERGLRADQEGGFVLAEHRAEDIGFHLGERTAVNLQEFYVRIGGRHLRQHVVELKPNRHHHLGAGLGGRLQVLALRGGIAALIGLGLAAQLLGHLLGAGLAEFQEVVDANRVGRDVDKEGFGVGRPRGGREQSGHKAGRDQQAFHVMLPGSAPPWRRSEQIQSNRAARRNRLRISAVAVGCARDPAPEGLSRS